MERSPALLASPMPTPETRRRVSFGSLNLEDVRVNLEDVRAALEPGLDVDEDIEELEVLPRRRSRKPLVVAHALSGMLGSVSAELILFPVDTVKLLIQTTQAGETTSFYSVFQNVIRTKGVAGLYKGISTSVLKESIHSFNYWLWHGLLFRKIAKADDTSKTPAGMRLVLNLMAKQLNWFCTVPFEVVSSVNQLAPDSPGFLATAKLLYRTGGIATFYRGLAISLTLAINPAIMNTLITTLLRLTAVIRMLVAGMDYESARDHGPAVIGFATALSKFLATVGTYPLIRAKVLQQTTDEELSIMTIWRGILRTEGPAGLYRGLLAMSYKTVCWNALMMMFKHALGPKRAITPPVTPPRLDPSQLIPPMPWMAREPFPVELITRDKLDEILSYLKRDSGQGDRVQKLEGRMNQISSEMREMKFMLKQVVCSLNA